MTRRLLALALLLSVSTSFASSAQKVGMLPGELWWGLASNLPQGLPLDENTSFRTDLWYYGFNNQTSPVLVSNRGRYIWVSAPFSIKVEGGVFDFTTEGEVRTVKVEGGLKEAYRAVSKAYFPPTGTIPEELFLSRPQYNTWIELRRNQNQSDILRYAHSIVDNGMSEGILMIDDNWQRSYGNYDFRAERFPDPKGMVDELHLLGFKVMLWVSPFVSADTEDYDLCRRNGYLLKSTDGKHPVIVNWWNGYSAVLDMSNPSTQEYLYDRLTTLQKEVGIDGFKFDGGDPWYYVRGECKPFDGISYGPLHTKLWAEFASRFPFNELRACWQMGGQPVVQRLCDKQYSWEDVSKLIPCMIAAGLLGHIYTCPDMVGGGSFTSFDEAELSGYDEALIVRSCQIHALMPMMQFSVAPWRILGKENLENCIKASRLHSLMGPYILEQARKSSITGEPLVRSLEYEFPSEGFERCRDQYMLGERYLVAPVVDSTLSRDVTLPRGRWRDETGRIYKGGRTYTIEVPMDRIPYFEKIQ